MHIACINLDVPMEPTSLQCPHLPARWITMMAGASRTIKALYENVRIVECSGCARSSNWTPACLIMKIIQNACFYAVLPLPSASTVNKTNQNKNSIHANAAQRISKHPMHAHVHLYRHYRTLRSVAAYVYDSGHTEKCTAHIIAVSAHLPDVR